MRAHPDRFTCGLTGAPLVNAVVTSDGTVAIEGGTGAWCSYTPDVERRDAFAQEVAARADAVTNADTVACTTWKRQMPEGGLTVFA